MSENNMSHEIDTISSKDLVVPKPGFQKETPGNNPNVFERGNRGRGRNKPPIPPTPEDPKTPEEENIDLLREGLNALEKDKKSGTDEAKNAFADKLKRKESEKPEFGRSWLVTDEKTKNVLDSIQNDSLKRRIYRLHEAAKTRGVLNRSQWTEEYLRLLRDADNPQLEADQGSIDVFLANMNAGIRTMDPTPITPVSAPASKENERNLANAMNKLVDAVSGEGKLDLPNVVERQREYVREILDGIENSNRDCADHTNAQIVRKLEISLQDMEPSIADEVRVRLSLHDSSELIKQAGGNIKSEGGGLTIGTAATEAQRRQHDITNRVAEVCYEESLPGLDIPQAWDLLQDANFKYPELIREVNVNFIKSLRFAPKKQGLVIKILEGKDFDSTKLSDDEKSKLEKLDIDSNSLKNIYSVAGTEDEDADPALGKVPTNYFTDSDIRRKNAAHNLLVQKIGGDERAAKKSLQLADKMAWGTLEVSVWNKSALAGNDQLAECIGLKDWRKRRQDPGRVAGPLIHQEMIDGFGTSWNRLQRPGKKDPGGKVDDDVNKPQYSKDVAINKIRAASWQGYCVANVGRYYALKELLLETEQPPDKINLKVLKSSIPYFNTADEPDLEAGEKTGDKRLRVWWLAGILDIAVTNPNLGWTKQSIDNLHVEAVLNQLSGQWTDEEGKTHGAGSFISEDQWNWLKIATDLDAQMAKLERRRGGLRATVARVFGGKK